MAIKTPKQQLVDMYNRANPDNIYTMVVADITTGTIGAYTPEDPDPELPVPNTALSVAADPDSQSFEGAMTWHYRRVPIGFAGESAIEDEVASWMTDEYVLAKFNSDLQRQYQDEFVLDDVEITREDNVSTEGTYDVTISFNRHLKFEDATVKYMIYPQAEKTDLSTTNGELGTFA